jgi:hypothetical protein
VNDGAILYLDFAGVMHPEAVYWHPRRGAYLGRDVADDHGLFEHASLLESLLEPYPHVRIVLSTSWVGQYRYSGAARRLPLGLRERCVGATFHSAMSRTQFERTPRGMQVVADVVRRRAKAWLALDDCRDGWPRFAIDHVVFTHEVEGIAHPDVLARLRSRLAEQFGEVENVLLEKQGAEQAACEAARDAP